MVEGKKLVPDQTGKMAEGDLVEVEEAVERFSDIKLADGTQIRIKPVVVEVVRVDGEWDNEGNPTYMVRTANVMVVDVADQSLKKRLQ